MTYVKNVKKNMNLTNATVTLTYQLGGVLTSRGCYEYKERTTKGSVLPEDQRLFLVKRATYSNCFKKTELGEAFVNHAISNFSQPTIGESYQAHIHWKKMSDKERLEFHIGKFVYDMNSFEYEYQIHEA